MWKYNKDHETLFDTTGKHEVKPLRKIGKILLKLTKICFVVIAVFGFVFALLVWYVWTQDTECEHNWKAATCTEPAVCTQCGETSGDPAGHKWRLATCTAARSCNVCRYVLGTPLGHADGETKAHTDMITAQVVETVYCKRCKKEIDERTRSLESFVKDDMFMFTPEEFLERMVKIVSECYEYSDVCYRVTSVEGMLVGDLYYGDGLEATFTFFRSNMYPVQYNELKEKDVFCVAMTSVAGEYTCEDLFLLACDPTLDRENAVFLYNDAYEDLMQSVSKGKDSIALFRNNMQFELQYLSGDEKKGTHLICIMSPDWQGVTAAQKETTEPVDISENEGRTLTTKWKDGAATISFWNDREFMIELTDDNLNSFSGNGKQTPLTQILLIYGDDPYDAFGIMLFHDGKTLARESFYVEDVSDMTRNDKIGFDQVSGHNNDDLVMIYGKLPDNKDWTLEKLRGISIYTHINKKAQEHYIEVS